MKIDIEVKEFHLILRENVVNKKMCFACAVKEVLKFDRKDFPTEIRLELAEEKNDICEMCGLFL